MPLSIGGFNKAFTPTQTKPKPLSKCTKDELIDLANAMGIDASGTKKELLEKIKEGL